MNVKDIKFTELIDIDKINMIIRRFYALTGIGSTLIDLEGNILTIMGPEAGWQDICMKFHRVHPETLKRCIESDTAFAMQLAKGVRYVRYRCLNGMVDVAIPIIIEGKHLVNLFSGQWMTDPPDIEFFRSQARGYGFDEKAYLDALSRVKVLSEEHVKRGIELLVLLTEIIAETALTHMRHAEMAAENAVIRREMELARKIQTVLLPKNPVRNGYDIAASMEPASEVGGDYYDVISVGGCEWLVIGDVSGHGVDSGLVMMMVQTAIHAVLIQNPQTPPSNLLSVINRTICENIERMDESKHMTIVVIACGHDGFFSFSGAHEDILLWCSDTEKVETIETDGVWIGLLPDISDEQFPVSEFRMKTGDCIVLYTDGIIESRGKGGEMFGSERLIKILEKYGSRTASEIHDRILEGLKDYEISDDVTLLVMKRI